MTERASGGAEADRRSGSAETGAARARSGAAPAGSRAEPAGAAPAVRPSSRILIVRHGPGLSRTRARLQLVLDHLADTAPELAARLTVHETGTPDRPHLDGVAAVVFWLADPPEFHFACYREATAIAEAARSRGIRLVNPPETYANTAKCAQARLLAAAGIPTPRCRRFADRNELEEILAAFTLPVVIRADLLHTQARTAVCWTREAALAFGSTGFPFPGVVTPYVDTRETCAVAAPGAAPPPGAGARPRRRGRACTCPLLPAAHRGAQDLHVRQTPAVVR